MKSRINLVTCFFVLLLASRQSMSQQPVFTTAANVKNLYGGITGLAEDKDGYLWFGCDNDIGSGGLHRFDGKAIISFMHNSIDTNSLANNNVKSLCIARDGSIWVGTWGGGLDRIDPVTKIFTHYRHRENNTQSLSNDFISSVLQDREGNIWTGTENGLNKLNLSTGKFTHYLHQEDKPYSISDNEVLQIYLDREGRIWIGTSDGLNLLDPVTGKFNRYYPCTGVHGKMCSNSISSVFEDNRGTFWVGTYMAGLLTLDRKTGIFSHYYYDASFPEQLAPPPLYHKAADPIKFIGEDADGTIWIGAYAAGINRFNPLTKTITHFVRDVKDDIMRPAPGVEGDSLLTQASCILSSTDGLFWIGTSLGGLYQFNPLHKKIPYYSIRQQSANSFYMDPSGALWIGTDNGLVKKYADGKEKVFVNNPRDENSISYNGVNVILPGKNGSLWLGTNGGGLDKFDPDTRTFTHFRHNEKDPASLSNDYILFLFRDHQDNLWVATQGGLDKLKRGTKSFVHYRHNDKDSSSIGNDLVINMIEENGHLWAGTIHGLNKLDESTGNWAHYFPNAAVKSVYRDHTGTIWLGATDGLYFYNSKRDSFSLYRDPGTKKIPEGVLNITEDNQHNLWVTTSNSIYRINSDRNRLFRYGSDEGIHGNMFLAVFSYKARDGKLFIGDQSGYYSFYPKQVQQNITPPKIYFTNFKIKNKAVNSTQNKTQGINFSQTRGLYLRYDQNTFSLDFQALYYSNPDSVSYRYMMKGYNDTWQDLGNIHEVSFFSVPPGHYVLEIKAITNNYVWNVKSLDIVIRPPWWTTWWAISMFCITLIGIGWGIMYYRSRRLRRVNKLLEEKVNVRTSQLNQSLKELKSTQKQLIQSEKLASLVEVTAGIAHEIQNPLNFVNNFSDINRELIEELKDERSKPVSERDDQLENEILEDIHSNEEKISHHGKRAQSIVSSMLEHSRMGTGKKELADINALCDEYLQLSYRAVCAKDKSFEATMMTEYDDKIGKINIVPQDVGRVLFNLFNNAFYACNERAQKSANEKSIMDKEKYQPTVWLSTKKNNSDILISVKDNGNGIPENIVSKIFQPFFTTKPTGQGTGLGLSLSYDIINAHNGEINVKTIQGEGTEFIIRLPEQYV